MKRLLLILPLLFTSLYLTACQPPDCGQTHEGWVRATVQNGYDAGSSITVHGLWTNMGASPACNNRFSGDPRRANNSPYEGCVGTCTSSSFPRYSDGTFAKQVGTAGFYDSTVEVYILNYRGSSAMEYFCMTKTGPATLRCEGDQRL